MRSPPAPQPRGLTTRGSQIRSQPPELEDGRGGSRRADLVFYGVRHSGPSYVARVFLNNPHATPTFDADSTGRATPAHFTVFGHNGCYGAEGHCEPDHRAPRDEFDLPAPHPLRAADEDGRSITEALAPRGLEPAVNEVTGDGGRGRRQRHAAEGVGRHAIRPPRRRATYEGYALSGAGARRRPAGRRR